MAGDGGCLARVLRSLDEYTIVVMRGSEEHAEEDLQLVARALTRRSAGTSSRLPMTGAPGQEEAASGPADDVMVVVTHSVLRMQVSFFPSARCTNVLSSVVRGYQGCLLIRCLGCTRRSSPHAGHLLSPCSVFCCGCCVMITTAVTLTGRCMTEGCLAAPCPSHETMLPG